MIVKILISQRTYTRFLFVYLRKQLAETIDRLGFKGEMRVFLKLCPVENRLSKSNFYILIHKKTYCMVQKKVIGRLCPPVDDIDSITWWNKD